MHGQQKLSFLKWRLSYYIMSDPKAWRMWNHIENYRGESIFQLNAIWHITFFSFDSNRWASECLSVHSHRIFHVKDTAESDACVPDIEASKHYSKGLILSTGYAGRPLSPSAYPMAHHCRCLSIGPYSVAPGAKAKRLCAISSTAHSCCVSGWGSGQDKNELGVCWGKSQPCLPDLLCPFQAQHTHKPTLPLKIITSKMVP